MTPEQMAQWVADLRSGKYVQGFGQFRGPDGEMCAIGVLRTLQPEVYWDTLVGMDHGLLHTVLQWNDKDHLTFPEIANRLEARA